MMRFTVMDDKKYTSEEIKDKLNETITDFTNLYFDKMDMRDIAVVTMFINQFKSKFKSEENDLNK